MGSREKGVMGLDRGRRSHAVLNRSRWQEPLSTNPKDVRGTWPQQRGDAD